VLAGGAKAAAVEGLLAEQPGQPRFQVADLLGEPAVLLVQVGVLGEHGPVADRGRRRERAGGRVRGGFEDGGVQVGVPVHERAVHRGPVCDCGW